MTGCLPTSAACGSARAENRPRFFSQVVRFGGFLVRFGGRTPLYLCVAAREHPSFPLHARGRPPFFCSFPSAAGHESLRAGIPCTAYRFPAAGRGCPVAVALPTHPGCFGRFSGGQKGERYCAIIRMGTAKCAAYAATTAPRPMPCGFVRPHDATRRSVPRFGPAATYNSR